MLAYNGHCVSDSNREENKRDQLVNR
jgi:hypothetical protein